MPETLPSQADLDDQAASQTPEQFEVTPDDIAGANATVIRGAARAYSGYAFQQLGNVATPPLQKTLRRQLDEANGTLELLGKWEQSDTELAEAGQGTEDFGEYLDRTLAEDNNPSQALLDAYSWVGTSSYNGLVRKELLSMWQQESVPAESSAKPEEQQPEAWGTEQKHALEEEAYKNIEQARGLEVVDDVVKFAKGKTRIHTTDTRGNFADVGDSPSRGQVGMPDQISQKEMFNQDWRQNLNEAVMFIDAVTADKHDVVKTRSVQGRFGRTHEQEYTVSEEVPGSEHSVLIHNEQTGQDEPKLSFLYQFKYSQSAQYVAGKELPRITGWDYRGGNLVQVGIDLPKSIADRLDSQIQQDPASVRSLVDKLVLQNNNGKMTAERWEGKDGRPPSRMPYDKLPDDWTIGLVRGTRKASDTSYQVERLSVHASPGETGLDRILAKASQAGIDEAGLKQYKQTLQMRDRPLDQMQALGSFIRRDSLNLTHNDLLKLVRNYQTETVKATEKGPLFHYHQTGFDNLENIIANGGLLSHDKQKQRGIARSAAGSRPDVVQLTRDKYNADGKLIKAGLQETSSGLGAAGDLAFVFDQSIMDDPDYDSLAGFPNVPGASLDKLHSLVVGDATKIPYVKNLLDQNGLDAEVVPRAEWLSRYGQTAARSSY